MPKRTTAIAAVVVLLFALTGCGEETATPADEPKPFAAPLTATEAPETNEPLVAETPAASDPEAQRAAFLDEARNRLGKIQSQIPNATDAQLLDAASEACDRLAAGESGDEVSLVEGEQLTNGYYMDSSAIIIAARLTLCPLKASTGDDPE